MKKSILTLLVLFVCAIQTTTAYEYFTIYFSDGTKSKAFYASVVDSICYSKIGLDSIAYDDWQVQEIYTIDSVYRYPLAQIDSLSFKDVDVNKSFDILNELFSITPNGQQLEIEDVIMYVKKHYDNANIEIRDSIIYLDIEGCETLRLDIYGKYMMESSDWVLDSLTLSNRMDSIMNVLGRDVQDTISTILSDSVFSEDDFNYSQSRQLNHRRSAPTNVTNNTTILTNNNLLIWSPWYYTESKYEHKLVFETLNTFANNLNKRRPDVLKLSPIQANGASLASIASMKSFSNYDVVFIDCHGTENGELIMPITKETEKIPGDVVGIWDNDTKKMIPGKVLDEKYMRRYLPNKLDHTILFTAMCYAYPSENHRSNFWSIANERKVADFMGATNKVTIKTPLERFTEFATTFFLGGTPTTKAFKNGPYTDTYKREDKTYKATGEYKHTINFVDVFYGYARPLPYNKQNQSLKGRMPLPQTYLSHTHAREGFRSAKSISSNFSNNVEAGFMLKNRTTGDVQLIPLTIDNVTDYQIYPLGDLMEDIVFEVKTDGLEPGHYAYSTYIWNGESLKLSNETQGFIIEDETVEAYYVWDEASKTSTYYFDGMRESRGGKKIRKEHHVDSSSLNVVFDSSFYNYYPKNFSFSYCPDLQRIDCIHYLNTDSITSMSAMFRECHVLTRLDLSSFNTSNVTDMGSMFVGCYSLENLDLSSFNTSNVTDMGSMFRECNSLTNLDLSSFNTSKVTNMAWMFNMCESLKELNLSHFNTENVTDMHRMFCWCFSLEKIKLSSFNTSKVTDMAGMFSNCRSLKELDVSSFDTSNLIDMSGHREDVDAYGNYDGMFAGCSSLSSIDISNFDTSKVTDMHQLFQNCTNLKEINMSGFVFKNTWSYNSIFSNCDSLTSINFSNGKIIGNACGLFSFLEVLKEIDLSNVNTSEATDFSSMFRNCRSLTQLDLTSFNSSNVTNTFQMFGFCSSLKTIYSNDWNLPNEISGNMFIECEKLFGGKGTKVGDNLYGYDKNGIPLYYHCDDNGSAAHIDGGKDNPGLFTAK